MSQCVQDVCLCLYLVRIAQTQKMQTDQSKHAAGLLDQGVLNGLLQLFGHLAAQNLLPRNYLL